jgi:hypothetical protein
MQIADREFDKKTMSEMQQDKMNDLSATTRRITSDKFKKQDIRTKILKDEIERITKQALGHTGSNNISNTAGREIIMDALNTLKNISIQLLEDK